VCKIHATWNSNWNKSHDFGLKNIRLGVRLGNRSIEPKGNSGSPNSPGTEKVVPATEHRNFASMIGYQYRSPFKVKEGLHVHRR